ncbi:hypothetical protein AYI69_g11498, partial [Smittium culicis]
MPTERSLCSRAMWGTQS